MTARSPNPKRIVLFGATGTIGRATRDQLQAAGHDVVCILRPSSAKNVEGSRAFNFSGANAADRLAPLITDCDAVVSCLASRTGAPDDAWLIDYQAHLDILNAAKACGIEKFVLLSAICVQKPLLEFQKAKAAFEDALAASGLTYSIVRPTAFFKSLSGQVARVRSGKPFLVFGDGAMTRCKPISDRDLGQYLTLCLDDTTLQNRILPIGGPGPAITPRQQGEILFRAANMEPKFRSAPMAILNTVIGVGSILGVMVPALRRKADFARIGRYYATESMLVWNGQNYDADATPEFGTDTLADHYSAMIEGRVTTELGDHAVF